MLGYRHQYFNPFEENVAALNTAVKEELQRLNKSITWKINAAGILHTSTRIKHAIEDLLINHAAGQFPTFSVVLETQEGCFVGGKGFRQVLFVNDNLQNTLEMLEQDMPTHTAMKHLKGTEASTWEVQQSWLLERRKNRAFLHPLPESFA
jgi:hypothetical protein